MTQFGYTLKPLLLGDKTETSRLVHEGDYTWVCGEMDAPWKPRGFTSLYSSVHHASDRPRFVAGKDYPIEPGRGKKSVGRYRILTIWRQDVRTMLLAQREAEGFHDLYGFWMVWGKMYDAGFLSKNGIYAYCAELKNRPEDRYRAWRMEIEVLWDTIQWDAPAVQALAIPVRTA